MINDGLLGLLYKPKEPSVRNSAVVLLFESGLRAEGLQQTSRTGLLLLCRRVPGLWVWRLAPALVPKGRFVSTNSHYLQSRLPPTQKRRRKSCIIHSSEISSRGAVGKYFKVPSLSLEEGFPVLQVL